MLLIIRISLFVLGFFYRFVPSVFGKPEFKMTAKGTQYGVYHATSKNGVITETVLWVPIAKRLRFRLCDENSWTHFCATIGFGSEFKISATVDHEFDRRFYIACDQRDFLSVLNADKEMQDTFLQMHNLGVYDFVSDGHGYLKLKIKGHFTRIEAIEQGIELTHERLKSLAVAPSIVDPYYARLLIAEAVIYGLVGYSVGSYFTLAWDPGVVHLDEMSVAIAGVILGALFLFVWFISVFLLMRRSSHAPLLVTDFAIAGFLIVVSGGPMMASDVNRGLDNSEAQVYRAGIYNTYSVTTGSGKNRKTREYLSLKYVTNPLQLPEELQVTDRYLFSPNQGLEIEVRDGFLNMKYIARLNTRPFPAELDPPGHEIVKALEEKRRLVIEVINANLAWQKETAGLGRLPNSEVVETKHRDGALKGREAFLNGKKEGVSTYFHPNGMKYAEIFWINDNRHGSFKVYREDGSLEQWTSYKDGKPHGMFAWFAAGSAKENPSHLAIYRNGEVVDGDRDQLLPMYLEALLPHFEKF